MATLKMGSTTMFTESSGALTINASNPTVTLGNNTTFPTGMPLQQKTESNYITGHFRPNTTQLEVDRITFTPISASSKIIIRLATTHNNLWGGPSTMYWYLRDGSITGANMIQHTSGEAMKYTHPGSIGDVYCPISCIMKIDSWGTTAKTLYWVFNSNNNNVLIHQHSECTMTLTEVME